MITIQKEGVRFPARQIYLWILAALVGIFLTACVRPASSGMGSLKGRQLRISSGTEEGMFKVPLPAPTSSPTPSPVPLPSVTHTQPALTATATAAFITTVTTTASQEMTSVPARTISVPILLYHQIQDDGNSRYILPVSDFRAQIKALAEAGYHTISMSRLAEVIRSGGQMPEKPIVLTFDDGYLDTYENAYPILKEFGFQGVVYVITGTVGTEKSYGYMQAEELQALVEAGWEIGSHSISHTDLKTSRLGMGTEIQKSKDDLEALLKTPIRTFSYPYGLANPWIEDRVKEYGYDFAVGLGTFITHSPKTLYYLSRREVVRGASLADFKALLEENNSENTDPTPDQDR